MTNRDGTGLSDITLWKPCEVCHKVQSLCTCRQTRAQGQVELPAEQWSDPDEDAQNGREVLAPGELVGQSYQIIRCLGTGGMSTVYLARSVNGDELVALKMLNASISLDEEARLRFERETRAMKRLSHPNLLTLKDYGKTAEGQRYFVMDYLDGRSLDQEIAQLKAIEQNRALHLFRQVCAGMKHAHEAGVVHRDLKPGNIFITQPPDQPDFVKVLDFGIAKLSCNVDDTESNLTQKGQVLGSPRYMSPEQCLGQTLDARSDIYSLGCVMYQAISGQTPFNGEHALAILYKQVNEAPHALGEMVPFGLSHRIESVVLKCLAKKREDRYQSMAELALALE